MKFFFLVLLLLSTLQAVKVEFEVLGSGGPELDGRASTSYLLWIDGKARLIVDMGSGSMLRFEESNARLETLQAIVLTHLHIDHSVDLPAFTKAGFFSSRTQSLDIIAPTGNEYFPSTDVFLESLFGKNGAYRYMQDVLTSQSDSFELIPYNISTTTTKFYKSFKLTLYRVHHGIVPALALRVDVDGKSIMISGDTNDADKTLTTLAKGVNLFVAHHAVPQTAKGYATELHMRPSTIAKIAKEAGAKKILLTHRMKRTIGLETETLNEIKKVFKREVVFAEDRMKIEL